ncbi:MAG: hypothetical protein JJU28_17500 [Cyclobacteriaceae bacterium]|nr:hypothetical protein [Cyclobacteriaceae bacterium]
MSTRRKLTQQYIYKALTQRPIIKSEGESNPLVDSLIEEVNTDYKIEIHWKNEPPQTFTSNEFRAILNSGNEIL